MWAIGNTTPCTENAARLLLPVTSKSLPVTKSNNHLPTIVSKTTTPPPHSPSKRRNVVRATTAQLWDGLKLLLTNKHLVFVVVQVLSAGFSLGFIGTFVYVLVQEQNSTNKWDITLCRTSLSAGAIFTYYVSKSVLDRFKASTIMIACLYGLSAVYLMLSQLQQQQEEESSSSSSSSNNNNMWWWYMMSAEALRGATFAILWSTVVVHMDEVSPPGSSATMVRKVPPPSKIKQHTKQFDSPTHPPTFSLSLSLVYS